MNKLSYRLNKEKTLYKTEAFEAVFNDIPLRWFFNIKELKKSAGSDGFYEIFLGNCLLSDCCGVYMEVIHEKNKVVWKRFLEPTDGERVSEEYITMPDGSEVYEVRGLSISIDKNEKPPIEFNKMEYEALVDELVKEKSESDDYINCNPPPRIKKDRSKMSLMEKIKEWLDQFMP